MKRHVEAEPAQLDDCGLDRIQVVFSDCGFEVGKPGGRVAVASLSPATEPGASVTSFTAALLCGAGGGSLGPDPVADLLEQKVAESAHGLRPV